MALLRNAQFYLDLLIVRTRMVLGSFLPQIGLVRTDMTGKTIVITGGNAGLGLELATKLASMNATVFLACRNLLKAEAARQEIISLYPTANVQISQLDQASLRSVSDFAANWTGGKIDVLINNAGLGYVSKDQEYTVDGLEALYQINFLSSFFLTKLMEPHLTIDGRVVFTSSVAAYAGFIGDNFALTRVARQIEPGFHATAASSPISQRYFTNKLMQAAFARALQGHFDRDPANKRLALSYDPGIVVTKFVDEFPFTFAEDAPYVITEWLMKNTGISVEQGAATGVYLSVTDDASVTKHYKGGYWSARVHRLTPADFYSQEKLDRLWIRWSADAGITWTS